jgi:hypothetical protein
MRIAAECQGEQSEAAYKALGELGGLALEPLLWELEPNATYGQPLAMLGLAHLGGVAVPSLLLCLRDGELWHREGAVYAFMIMHQFAQHPITREQEQEVIAALRAYLDNGGVTRLPDATQTALHKWLHPEEHGCASLVAD